MPKPTRPRAAKNCEICLKPLPAIRSPHMKACPGECAHELHLRSCQAHNERVSAQRRALKAAQKNAKPGHYGEMMMILRNALMDATTDEARARIRGTMACYRQAKG